MGFSRSGVCCLPMPTPIGQPVQAIKQRLATSAARAATALRSEGSERSKDSRPSVSRGNVPTLKRLKRLIATDADEKAFLVSLLPFRVSSACGGVTSSAAMAGGKRPLPVPASAELRRARVSPTRSWRSGTDLPQSLRRDISKAQKGRLRNNEHLSNLYSRISAS